MQISVAEQENVLVAILDELRRQRVSDDLWTVDDVATYLKLSKSRVQGRVTCRDDFPRPMVIPTTEEGGGKRWLAKEVKAWAMRHRA